MEGIKKKVVVHFVSPPSLLSCLTKFKYTSNVKPTSVLNLVEQMRERERENGSSESRLEVEREEREEVLAF